MAEPKIRVKLIGEDSHTAYITLPGYPNQTLSNVVARTICVDGLVENFKGPRVHLDFNSDGVLIGIEILVFNSAEAE